MTKILRAAALCAFLVLVPLAALAGQVILLTADQAGQVQGPSDEKPRLAALAPQPLTDGRFILGAEVLADPDHIEDRAFLSTLPQADYADIVALLPPPPGP